MQNTKSNIKTVVVLIIVAGAIVFGIYSLMKKTENQSVATDDMKAQVKEEVSQVESTDTNKVEKKEDINKVTTENKNMENKRLMKDFTPIKSTPTLVKKDFVVGTGVEVKAGATVSVHYTGAIAATGEVFQSSKDFGVEPITFPLSGVIKGWTDGIPGMKVGGTRRLIIPSAQAYGANPPQGSGIPANADLVFDVELISVK